MQQRRTAVELETLRHRITGVVLLPPEGYRSRLTDYLNAHETGFIPLTGVRVTPLDGSGVARELPYLVVSCRHIVLAVDDDGGGGAAETATG